MPERDSLESVAAFRACICATDDMAGESLGERLFFSKVPDREIAPSYSFNGCRALPGRRLLPCAGDQVP